jgi:hypothetical protein
MRARRRASCHLGPSPGRTLYPWSSSSMNDGNGGLRQSRCFHAQVGYPSAPHRSRLHACARNSITRQMTQGRKPCDRAPPPAFAG